MAAFEMIKYHSQDYPANVPLRIEDIAVHFDVQRVGATSDGHSTQNIGTGREKLIQAVL